MVFRETYFPYREVYTQNKMKGENMRTLFCILNSFWKSYQTKKEAQKLEELVNIARFAY